MRLAGSGSPIRQRGKPLRIPSQGVSVWMAAGSMSGLASKANARNVLSRGNPAARMRRSDRRRARSSPFGEQQLGEERAVGQVLVDSVLGDLVADTDSVCRDRSRPVPAAGIQRLCESTATASAVNAPACSAAARPANVDAGVVEALRSVCVCRRVRLGCAARLPTRPRGPLG